MYEVLFGFWRKSTHCHSLNPLSQVLLKLFQAPQTGIGPKESKEHEPWPVFGLGQGVQTPKSVSERMYRVCEWERLFLPLLVQNGPVKRLTVRTIKAGIEVSQRSYIILDTLNSATASVLEMVCLAEDPVRAV